MQGIALRLPRPASPSEHIMWTTSASYVSMDEASTRRYAFATDTKKEIVPNTHTHTQVSVPVMEQINDFNMVLRHVVALTKPVLSATPALSFYSIFVMGTLHKPVS